MSSALKLISLETANMGRPRFYYKSFHKKAIIIIQEIITTLRWLLSFCMNLNTVQKKYKAGFTHREPGNLAFVLSLYSVKILTFLV